MLGVPPFTTEIEAQYHDNKKNVSVILPGPPQQSPIIKVPVPPKRNANFSGLAKYLSGSGGGSDGVNNNSINSVTAGSGPNGGPSSSKRRKTRRPIH